MDVTDTHRANSLRPKNRTRLTALGAAIALIGLGLLGYFASFQNLIPGRNALLSSMPDDARAVFFVDLHDLRQAPFFADLLAWAPKPGADQEYRQFVRETGFDYERDLERVAVAFEHDDARKIFFAVADGHFDQKKIKTYAAKNGALHNSAGAEIFSVPMAGNSQRLYFTFLRKDRMAFTNNNDFGTWLHSAKAPADAEWRERFARVAGSPVFAVLRNEALKEAFNTDAASQDLARRATAGFSSPQLSSLLAQLQWLTLACKPENEKLRVSMDAESLDKQNAQQLADLLNGVVLLARVGLGNVRTEQHLRVSTRQSYLALLKSVEVSRMDRPDTKSVRVIFDVTPELLKSAPIFVPGVPAPK